MIAWIRWQRTCLADDYRYSRYWLRRLWRRWWLGKPGRHGTWQDYSTSQMVAIEAELAERLWPGDLADWPLDAAPALLNIPPVPGPELLPDDEPAWVAEATLRGFSPHVYAPAADYWAYAWWAFEECGFYGSKGAAELRAWDEAEANQLRAECGLPPRLPAPPQFRELTAA